MNITINTQATIWFIIILFLLVVGTLLTIALLKLIKLTNKISKLVNENEEKVKVTMKNVAEITENTNKISLSLKDVTTEVAGSVSEFTANMKSSSVGIASNIVTSILRFIKKR